MSLVEFIGFVITFAAMIFLFARKASEEKRRRADPEGWKKKQRKRQEALQKLYTVHEDHKPLRRHREEEPYEDEEEERPLPVPQLKSVQKKREVKLPHSPPVAASKLPVSLKPAVVKLSASVAKAKVRHIPKKEMVILSTLFGPPKSLR